MTPTDPILRFDGAVEHDPAIEAWFDDGALLRVMVEPWFRRMRACGPDVLELFHDGCPVVLVGDVPFAYVNAFKAHVNVGFFHGAFLPDPKGLLEGTGKRMRHVKLRPEEEVDEAGLEALIEAAYGDVRGRG